MPRVRYQVIRRTLFLGGLLTLAVLMAACDPPPIAKKPKPVSDFSQLVVVGDSLSAGHQNSCLVETQQPHGFAVKVAEQTGAELTLPLVGMPGARPCMIIQQTGNPLSIVRIADADDTTQYGQRVNPAATPNNIAVPGTRLVDAVYGGDPAFFGAIGYPYDYMHNLVLDPGETMLDRAEALSPTTVLMWLGNNDALWAAIMGTDTALTPPNVFEIAYNEALRRMKKTGATVVVANIPDPTVIPHLIPAATAAGWFGTDLATVGPILGVSAGDSITLTGLTEMAMILQGYAAPPLSDNAVTDAAELAAISDAVTLYNQIITLNAHAHNALMVDTNALLNDVHQNGINIGGTTLTTDFCGGVFSLDGIHPSNTGYAVTANEFIQTINDHFKTTYPLVDTTAVLAQEPLHHFCVAAN